MQEHGIADGASPEGSLLKSGQATTWTDGNRRARCCSSAVAQCSTRRRSSRPGGSLGASPARAERRRSVATGSRKPWGRKEINVAGMWITEQPSAGSNTLAAAHRQRRCREMGRLKKNSHRQPVST